MLLCVLLAACSPGTASAPDGGKPHPTIVSLNPCTDAILADVAGPGQLLAISHFSHDPSASSMDPAVARRFRAVSGSAEEVARLAPDVVVASSFLPPATQQALSDMGIRVVTEPIATTVAASEAQVRQLAALAGRPAAGKALVGRIDAAIARGAPPAGSKPLSALVWESGGIVAGDDTLIAELMTRTGFANAAAARGLSQAQYLPLERVLADPPRVIFAVGDPRANEDRMLGHPALAGLNDTLRVPFPGALLWCGGPTIPAAVERLAKVRREVMEP